MSLLILASCNTSEAELTKENSTAAPTQTSEPSPTHTQYPTLTPVPSPTPFTMSILPSAVEMCGGIGYAYPYGMPVTATRPVIALKKTEFDDDSAWDIFYVSPDLEDASSIRTLLCIRERRLLEWTYSDGSGGYRLSWNIVFVGWPDGEVYGWISIRGELPPKTKPSSGDRYSSDLDQLFLAWMGNQ